MPDNSENPYGFIMNPEQNRRSNHGPRSNQSRIVLVVAMFSVLAIVLIVGVSFILSLGKAGNDDIIDIHHQQVELNRILDLGLKNVSDQAIANRLVTLNAAVISDQANLDALLTERKIEIPKEQINKLEDPDVDAELEKAIKNGNHDEVFANIVTSRSQKYYAALKAALTDTASKKEKSLLEKSIENVEVAAGPTKKTEE